MIFFHNRKTIYNILLFSVVFVVVLGLFLLWYQLFPQSEKTMESLSVPVPILRIGVAHQFLANVIQEIGGSYVSTVVFSDPSITNEYPVDICEKSSVFFGLNQSLDGWMQEVCGPKSENPIKVFLDSYIGTSIDQDISTEPSTTTPPIISGEDKGYYWLSTQGGKDMVRAIAKILSEADPVHKISYFDNAYAVAYQLDDVFGSVKDPMSNLHVAPVLAWGDGWQELVAEYNGTIIQTIDPIQSADEHVATITSVAQYLKAHKRAIVIGDLELPFNDIKKIYSEGARRIVVLDPTGDFSDIWPYKAFVQQNLLRVTQAL